jgi:tRNA G18 (ribose-2'-O)-methylase SpoU
MPDQITDPQDPAWPTMSPSPTSRLRRRTEPEGGLYIAESEKVIRRALAAGHRPRSYLMAQRWLTDLGDVVPRRRHTAYPSMWGSTTSSRALTGFHLHRGALAAMHRPTLPAVADVLAGARRVLVLEDIVDHTNVGRCFRVLRRARRRCRARHPTLRRPALPARDPGVDGHRLPGAVDPHRAVAPGWA